MQIIFFLTIVINVTDEVKSQMFALKRAKKYFLIDNIILTSSSGSYLKNNKRMKISLYFE